MADDLTRRQLLEVVAVAAVATPLLAADAVKALVYDDRIRR